MEMCGKGRLVLSNAMERASKIIGGEGISRTSVIVSIARLLTAVATAALDPIAPLPRTAASRLIRANLFNPGAEYLEVLRLVVLRSVLI